MSTFTTPEIRVDNFCPSHGGRRGLSVVTRKTIPPSTELRRQGSEPTHNLSGPLVIVATPTLDRVTKSLKRCITLVRPPKNKKQKK